MALHLITGYAGHEHITSQDQGAYNMATYGEGEFVISGRGQEFKANILSNNSISIEDGEALMQGRFIKMPIGTTESLSIDNGTQGNKRCDLIVIRYNKNSSTGVETTTLAVVKGTEGSSYVEPSVVSGTITDGDDIVNEMKLYAVRIDGINIDSVVKKFTTKVSMVDYMANYQLEKATANKLGGVKVNSAYTYGVGIDSNGTLYTRLKNVGSGLNLDSNGEVSVQYLTYDYTYNPSVSVTIPANSAKLIYINNPNDSIFSNLDKKAYPIMCVADDRTPLIVASFLRSKIKLSGDSFYSLKIKVYNFSSSAYTLETTYDFRMQFIYEDR